ncbi:MAG: hypothetical protein KatS3mg060_0529 [Dehalococcoidia bacterium]|nr:MAG: hypothetical protein KatS3mg060_0529 [Dehalococcoidia bacterium]
MTTLRPSFIAGLAAVAALAAGTLVLAPLLGSARAQGTAGVEPRTITVTGSGQVSAAPEIATVRLGVQERASTAQDALGAVSAKIERVVAALRALGVPEAKIQTQSLNVYPVQDRSDPAGTTPPTSYQASSILAIELDSVQQVGPTIDAAIQAGANQVQGVQFGLRDESAARQRAIDAAVRQARTEAQALAGSLGVTLGAVHHSTVLGGASPAVAMVRADTATAVQPGQIDVTVQVQVTFVIA